MSFPAIAKLLRSWQNSSVPGWHSISLQAPIHFKTLGLHATEYSQVFRKTRFFEMGRTKRRVRRCRILKAVSMSADKLNPFASHNWIFGELIHADARRERSVLTTWLIGSTSNAISASLSLACLTFRHTESIFWHQNDVAALVTWYFDRAIRIPFLRAK